VTEVRTSRLVHVFDEAVLRVPYCSAFAKRELSNTAKLSVFKSVVCIPILINVMNLR